MPSQGGRRCEPKQQQLMMYQVPWYLVLIIRGRALETYSQVDLGPYLVPGTVTYHGRMTQQSHKSKIC